MDIPFYISPLLASPETAIAISISGGKDSQAMLNWLIKLKKLYKWRAKIFCIHADLGRIEWTQTAAFVEKMAEDANLPLIIVRREKGDMIDRWKERFETIKEQGNDRPFWSSSQARYCTSDLKVSPINKYLRQFSCVFNCIGLRAEESKGRAKKPVFAIRDISASYLHGLPLEEAILEWKKTQKGRLAIDWLPIHDWNLDTVWHYCQTSTEEWQRRRLLPDNEATDGWPAHPAYVLGHGNNRLSCAFCVLGDKNDLTNAIAYNRDTYDILVRLERESGWSFQDKKSLGSLLDS